MIKGKEEEMGLRERVEDDIEEKRWVEEGMKRKWRKRKVEKRHSRRGKE